MGDPCKPKNQVALDRAMIQQSGRDIFTEAERVNKFDADQRFHYENQMSRYFGIDEKSNKPSVYDTMRGRSKQADKPGLKNDRFYAKPSEQFSKAFYGGINKKILAWGNKKNANIKTWKEDVSKPVKSLLDAIDKVVLNTNSRREMNAKLAKFGLDADSVYDARTWLQWLEKGGHLQKDPHLQPLMDTAGKISRAQANLNLLWTGGNMVDLIRVYSHYTTNPKAIIQGTIEAIKRNPFKRDAELHRQHLYETQYSHMEGPNYEPFSWSVTLQKNLAYRIDRAAGGNGADGIRKTIFDSTPWDRALYDRSTASPLIFGLARYPINETRWYYKTMKKALTGDANAAVNMVTWHMARFAMTGIRGSIPFVLYLAMPKDWKESIKGYEDQIGINWVKQFSKAAFKSAGINAEYDLTDYIQPGGGSLGARAGSIVSTLQKTGKLGLKTGIDTVKGNIPAAGVNAIATVSALANLTGYSKVFKGVSNSTTITNILDTAARELEGEFKKPGTFERELTKDTLGARVIKEPDKEKSNLRSLPSLPKLKAL